MNSRLAVSSAGLTWALTLLTTGTSAGQARYEYAAKIVCGRPIEYTSLAPQTYATNINVRNPNDSVVMMTKEVALTAPPGHQRPGQPLKIAIDTIPPGRALVVDCLDLSRRNKILGSGSFEGFVVLRSQMSLDVVAVYTVPGGIDVVTIAPRPVPR